MVNASENPLQKFPKELFALRAWCLWKYVERNGQPSKLPFQPNGIPAESNNSATWNTYEDCIVALRAEGSAFEGVGIFVTPGYAWVDFDKCRNPETGEIEQWAADAIRELDSYTELSPSGKGFHILCSTNLSKVPRNRCGRVELYVSERYFTVTGEHVDGTPLEINPLPKGFENRIVTLDPAQKKPAASETQTKLREPQQFALLMAGKIVEAGFKDPTGDSDADIRLCGILARKFDRNPQLIDHVFRSSGLMRSKWDEMRGAQTYGQMTIEKALQGAPTIDVPDDVDFDAPEAVTVDIPQIPREAMYGKLHEIATQAHCPMGYAYPAALAAAAGAGIEGNSNIRPTLYVVLTGDIHSGKSVTRERLAGIFHPTDRFEEHVIERTPASDQGLYNIFADSLKTPGNSFLLSLDEIRNMMNKTGIEGSSLPSALCELWGKNESGSADKKGNRGVNVKLSILGCLKAKDPSEFADVFNFATAQGLYDRFIFGIRAGEKWQFNPWSHERLSFTPSRPTVSPDVYETAHKWRSEGNERERLMELALRVAYISCAANGDKYLNDDALRAALRFMEWQEQIRAAYQPARGANEWQECMNAVLDAFEKAPGKALNWRKTATAKNWYRKFPRAIKGVQITLERDGVIELSKEHRKHFFRGAA